MVQAKLVFVASYCFAGKCQYIGFGISISSVRSDRRPHLASRNQNQTRCRDYITSCLESGNGPETSFWSFVGLHAYLQYHLLILVSLLFSPSFYLPFCFL
jgi:hypothetical protein